MAHRRKSVKKDKTAPEQKKNREYILIVEDDSAQAALIKHILQTYDPKTPVIITGTLKGYKKVIAESLPGITLLDINLPDGKAFEVLTSPPETGSFPIVVMTSYGDERTAVRAMKSGALDYVVKSQEAFKDIPRVLERVRHEWKLMKEKMRVEEELKVSTLRYRSLYENITIGLYRSTPDGKILMANDALVKMLGFNTFEELSKRNLTKAGFAKKSDRQDFLLRIEKDGEVKDFEAAWVRLDGSVLFVREFSRAVKDSDGKILYFDGSVEDVTARKIAEAAGKEAESALRRVTRLYATLSQVNHIIVRVKNRDELFRSICRIAIRYGQFRLAWIGTIDEKNGKVTPVTYDGYENGYLRNIKINIRKDSQYGRGPTGTSIREGRLAINNDSRIDPKMEPWRSEALKRGYMSSAAVPLVLHRKVIAILNLYSSEQGFFADEEQRLLEEIGSNISFALEMMESETEREVAEEKILESESQRSMILDSINEIIYSTEQLVPDSEQSAITFVSQRLKEKIGFYPEEFVKNRDLWFSLVHPDDRKSLIEQTLAIFRTKKPGLRVYRILNKNTEKYAWVEDSVFPKLDEKGRVIATFGVVRDISDHRKADEALRKSEKQFHDLFEDDLTGDFVAKLEGTITLCNPAFAKMMGFAGTVSALGKSIWSMYINSADAENAVNLIKASGKVENYEVDLVRDDGIKVRIIQNLVGEYDNSGVLTGIKGYLFDVTERKKAEEAKLEVLARFSGFAEASQYGMGMADLNGNIIYVNRTLARMLGEKSEVDCIGKHFPTSYYSEQMGRRLREEVMPALMQEGNWHGELELLTIDGRNVPTDENYFVIRDEDGRPKYLADILTDMTERKQNENILQARVRLIEYSLSNPLDRLMQSAIDEICALTGSPIGFFHFVESDQTTLSLQAWSTKTLDEMCNVEGFKRHYGIEEAGVWADCVREHKPVVHNDYAGLPHRKGMPEGHAAVIREMVFPIIRNRKIVAIIGVGNKTQDYTDNDVIYASRFADLIWDIVERKRTEDAARQREIQFKNLFMSLSDGFYISEIIKDKSGNPYDYRYIEVNPRFEKITEMKRDQIIGKTYRELVPVDTTKWLDNYLEVSRTGESRSYEFYSDEFRKYFETYAYQSAPGQISVFVRDITARKKSEASLRESEEKFRGVVETALEGIWFLDKEFKTTEVNDAVVKMLGYTQDELIGKSFVEFVYEEDREAQIKEFESRKKGISGRYERRVRCRDGSIKWLFLSAKARLDAEGKMIGTFAMITDITERKIMEDALRESEESYRGLINGMNETVWIIDFDGDLLDVNNTALSTLGYSKEELIKIGLYGVDSSLKKEEIQALARAMPEDKLQIFETTHRTSSGRIFPVEVYSSLITYHGKKAILSIARDITERKLADEKLRQMQKLEGLGTLAGGIAHDFNNILAIILAYITNIRNSKGNNEKIDSSADIIRKTVQRGKDLVQQILTFAKKTETEFGPVNINDVMMEIMVIVLETFPKTITCTNNLEKVMPLISADRSQLHQALLNLCVNARDAMPNGGWLDITTNIVSGTVLKDKYPEAAASEYACIEVSDTGEGMDEDTQGRIFEPFFTTKEKGKGTGLGLAVVFGIIQSHKGFIEVKSEIGKGSTFSIYLPTSRNVEPINEIEVERNEEIRGGNETILLIEDEANLLVPLLMILEEKGYKVISAKDGLEGLEVFKEKNAEIALVLTDLGLPGISGLDVSAEINRLKPDTKVIVATGFLDPEMKSKFLEANVRHFLFKPYEMANVLKSIREVLDGK